jgi:hypothetical protein
MRPLLLVRSDDIYAIIAPVWFVVRAAEPDGVQLPDTLQMDGKFGPRTFSLLGILIYVASLYLEHLSTDPQEIIQSPNTKLLTVRFERSVSADAARKAWREGLENNCVAACRLDPADVERFLAMVPAMHAGDNYSMLFAQHSAMVTASGHQFGTVSQPQFADVMLATFLGPNPASPELKRELLQGHG